MSTQPIKKYQISQLSGDAISYLAVGDTCVLTAHNDSNKKLFSDEIMQILCDKDFSSVNLECPLTEELRPIRKCGPNFAAPPASIKALKQGGFDLAVLANNHILDQGADAMWETVRHCKSEGIETVGVGENSTDAAQPFFTDIKGNRIATLAFTHKEFSSADISSPGAANLEMSGSVVMEASSKADIVIVNAHAGSEYSPVPSPRLRACYKHLIDCGADAIIGHHPHAIQGIEIYKNKPIIYSLGNFLFQLEELQLPCFYIGMIAKLIISEKKIAAVEVYPFKHIPDGTAAYITTLEKEESDQFSDQLDELDRIVNDSDMADMYWKSFCQMNRRYYFCDLRNNVRGIEGCFNIMMRQAIKKGRIGWIISVCGDFLDSILRKKTEKTDQMIRLQHLLRCPDLLEVFITLLEMENSGDIILPEAMVEFKDMFKKFGLVF